MRLGLTIISYAHHWRQRNRADPTPRWRNALDVLDHCHRIGAGSLQIGVRTWSDDFAGKVREKREALGIAIEGQVSLPKKDSDLDRFDGDLRKAKEAGAKTVRAVCLGGRRYETFNSLDDWNAFVKESYAAVERAEPLAAKQKVQLAIENHKDWRTDEHLALLRHIDSEWLGVNFDFGNNLALLENPVDVAAALAPFIMTTHVKDMALARSPDGFRLSEVPLGQGGLDLAAIITHCRHRNPDVLLNLEMITRNPLHVPVLGDKYWQTMPDLPAADLAATLARAGTDDLPTLDNLSPAQVLAAENRNVEDSFTHAREHLGLT